MSHNPVSKVFYKGKEHDFIVFVSSPEIYAKYLKDPSVALVSVVDSFKVFTSRGGGSQGKLDEASGSLIENQFGTSSEEEAIVKILKSGELQESKGINRKAWESTNDSIGARGGH
ncbi:ribosome maturation protein [Lipomyces japonicus]|uniref:ribosome maturation protein n=1 Tax=Lipomyces japonicus TaxID=56871 RepID=UPI0034CE6F32